MYVLFHKNGFAIYRCSSCGLGRTDLKKPYDTFLKEYYNEGYFTGDVNRVAYVSYRGDKQYILRNQKKYIQILKQYKSSGQLLDVGCALGYFVQLAQESGYSPIGCDPSSYAVTQAKKINDKLFSEGTLQTLSFPKRTFDIVTMLDVFEHLHDPRKDLQIVHSLLRPGGILFIATGDTDSLLAKILKRRWTFYIPPQHLSFFNRSTITTLLLENGFRVRSFTRVGKWLSLRYVLHLAKTTGESTVASVLDRMIEKTHLGNVPLYLPVRDNMNIVAEKI